MITTDEFIDKFYKELLTDEDLEDINYLINLKILAVPIGKKSKKQKITEYLKSSTEKIKQNNFLYLPKEVTTFLRLIISTQHSFKKLIIPIKKVAIKCGHFFYFIIYM